MLLSFLGGRDNSLNKKSMMKKYFYFTALVIIRPQVIKNIDSEQSYYVSGIFCCENEKGLFNLSGADVKVGELLQNESHINSIIDIGSTQYIFVQEVPEYDFKNHRGIIKKIIQAIFISGLLFYIN